MGKYKIYKHTNKINNKIYIGITKQTLKERWKDGFGYSENKEFFKDIVYFGWSNFEHEVILRADTEKEALRLESEMIKKYNTTDSRFGYNKLGDSDLNSEYKNGKKWSKKRYLASNEYYQYNLKGEFVARYNCLKDVIEKNPTFKQSGLSQNINGKTKNYRNYIWSHKPLPIKIDDKRKDRV